MTRVYEQYIIYINQGSTCKGSK